MSTKLTKPSPSEVELVITGDDIQLTKIKTEVLGAFKSEVSAPGFRKGHVPLDIIEKQVEKSHLEREFLDHALNYFYQQAVKEHNLKPISQPQVAVIKFVPFTTLEFKVTVEVVPQITLNKYKSMSRGAPTVKVSKEEVDKVVANIRLRMAVKKSVDRASKEGDELIIDFVGTDEKGQKIQGGDGKDYPLVLGSKTFIMGFEENLVAVKKGAGKTFEVTFPKSYGAKALAGRKATFSVHVKEVKEVILPEMDDELAKKVGPFNNVKELLADINKQLSAQKLSDEVQKLKNDIILEIAEKSKLELPKTLVQEQRDVLKQDLIKNLTYRGKTWAEYLAELGKTEDEYLAGDLKKEAETKVKVGLTLSEIADIEGIKVSPEEFEAALKDMVERFSGPEQQAQISTPEFRRQLLSRLMTQKTVDYLYGVVVRGQ